MDEPHLATNSDHGGRLMRYARARVWLLPALTVLGLGLARLWGGDYQVDTGLYAGVAWRMVRTGDWWTPMAGDVPYFNKPPLVIWLHAACMWLLRPLYAEAVSPPLWVIRLPLVLTAAACCSLTAIIARRLSGAKTGLLAGMILALTFPFSVYLNRFILDYGVVALLLGGVWLVAAGVQEGRWGKVVLAGAPIGLSMLCKPLFGLVALPILCVWSAIPAAWGGPGRWRLGPAFVGAGAFAVLVAAPWHLSMLRRWGDVFTEQYVGREVVSRGQGVGGFTSDPWTEYLMYIGREFHPWLLALVPMLVVLGLAAARRRRLRRPAGVWLCVVWSAGWLVLLSGFGDKRIRYMMHVWPFLAWLAALYLVRYSPRRLRSGRPPGTKRLEYVALAVLLLGAVVGGLRLVPASGHDADRVRIAEALVALGAEQPGGAQAWACDMHPPHAGEVYLLSGVWPRAVRDPARPGGELLPPEGSLVVWLTEFLDELAPETERLVEGSEYTLVRWAGVRGVEGA